MEISRAELELHDRKLTEYRKITEYVDYAFTNYISTVSCPKDSESYRDWFINEFLQDCITRWYEPSCYDINNMFSVNDFFGSSIDVFSDILQILSNYSDDCDKIPDTDKFNPKTVMRRYTSIYVINNYDYFLNRCQDEYDNIINRMSETSDIISIDLFHPEENTTNLLVIPPFNIISDDEDDVDDEDNVDDDDDDDDNDTTIDGNGSYNSSLPPLINIIDDDDAEYDTDEDIYNENRYYETGVFVSENEFNEKNKNENCIICWEIVMNYANSMKWNNCDHFTCISCHDSCMIKRLYKCPLCRL
jgi:hypothetical protein